VLVRFLVTTCGNVYDDRVENVDEPDDYDQPATIQNMTVVLPEESMARPITTSPSAAKP